MFVGQQNHGFALIFKERDDVLFALFACKVCVRDITQGGIEGSGDAVAAIPQQMRCASNSK